MNKVFYHITAAAISLTLLASCIKSGETPKVENYVKPGDTMPTFTVDADGANPSLSSPEYFSEPGIVSMVALFHSECPDCRREMEKFIKVWKQIEGDGDCRAVAFARGQTRANVLLNDAANTGNDWSYNDIMFYGDPNKYVFGKFANAYVPRLYIVDKKGIIRYMQVEHWKENGKYITTERLLEIVNFYRNETID